MIVARASRDLFLEYCPINEDGHSWQQPGASARAHSLLDLSKWHAYAQYRSQVADLPGTPVAARKPVLAPAIPKID